MLILYQSTKKMMYCYVSVLVFYFRKKIMNQNGLIFFYRNVPMSTQRNENLSRQQKKNKA